MRRRAKRDGALDPSEKPPVAEVLALYSSEPVDTGPGRGKTLCVIHDESVPSLAYDNDRGTWKCFSCGESGDSLTLIMMKEGTDFAGALSFAAEHFGTGSSARKSGAKKKRTRVSILDR